MMRPWMSAQEIAALRLPGLPTSDRGVKYQAERRGWPARRRQKRGGGLEYQLPPAEWLLLRGASHRRAHDAARGDREQLLDLARDVTALLAEIIAELRRR